MIIAIDPGTRCGWATGEQFGAEDIGALPAAPTKGRAQEPEWIRPGKLWALLSRLATDALVAGTKPTIVCEAATGYMKGKDAVRVSNELRGVVKAWCCVQGARYVQVEPIDLQRFACGKKADKIEMHAAAVDRLGYPHPYTKKDEDQVDARWLLEWARSNLTASAAA